MSARPVLQSGGVASMASAVDIRAAPMR
jgi:hypothetical protein